MSISGNSIILPDKFRDPYIYENILSMQGDIFSGKTTIDLSRVAFMEPYSMISFLIMGRNYLRSSGDKLKLVNVPIDHTLHKEILRNVFLHSFCSRK